MKRPLLLVVALVLVALLGAGGWWWQRAGALRDRIAAALPAVPDLGSVNATMRSRIQETDAKARSQLHARAGLAELGRIYHANGFFPEAMACDEMLERLEPAEPRWYHRQASILAGYGDVEPAMKLWQRVLALAPDYLPARLRIGDSELKAEHLDAAAAAYQEVLMREPNNAYALMGLARIDVEAHRWEPAQEKLETVFRSTDYQIGGDLLVMVYRQLGHPELARAILASSKASGIYRDPPDPWIDELLDECYDPYRISLAAGVLARSGSPAKAIAMLQRALTIAPDDVSTRFQLGMLLIEQHQTDAGREQLQRCTEIAPEFSDGWIRLSALQTDTGDRAGGDRTLAEGLRRCPDSPGMHLTYARKLDQAGRTGEAIGEYFTAIRLRPNEPDAYVDLGNTLIKLGRTDEAVQQMQAALATDPGHPMALAVMAFTSIAAKDKPEARRWMQRVADQPRIEAERFTQLQAAYREQFGEDWQP